MTPLERLIGARHHELIGSTPLNTRALLHALAEVETTQGVARMASRHEKGYCYGSALYTGTTPGAADLREQSRLWGCLAHSSWGTWQIMFIAAFENGFRGDPVDLRADDVAIGYVIRYINRRILGRFPGLGIRAFGDAYNSGDPRDNRVPESYMDELEAAYATWSKALEPPQVLKT